MKKYICCVLILFFSLVNNSYPLVYVSKDNGLVKKSQNTIKSRSQENNGSKLSNEKRSVLIQGNETVRIKKR